MKKLFLMATLALGSSATAQSIDNGDFETPPYSNLSGIGSITLTGGMDVTLDDAGGLINHDTGEGNGDAGILIYPGGGTWQFKHTMTGLSPGFQYRLQWEINDTANTGDYGVTAAGEPEAIFSTASTGVWSALSILFTATGTSDTFTFRTDNGLGGDSDVKLDRSRWDNFTVAPVPEASFNRWALGLTGIYLASRCLRRK